MIRTLRKRFVLSAMAAFAILLLILMLGVFTVSYIQMENRTDAFMQMILEEDKRPSADRSMLNPPARRMRMMENPIAYYEVQIDADGSIADITEKGIWEPDMEAVRLYTEEIIASGSTSGKNNGFKFNLQTANDGSARLILVDSSPQAHALWNVLQTTLLLSFACLVLLFLILLPISARVVHSYALHIEKQKQFITNAGHEIKTPVAIMLSNLDAMELIQGENKWSRNIRSQTDRLNALLQRLLFMSRIDETSLVLPMQMLGLSSVMESELETYKPVLAERKLQLHCNLGREIRIKGNLEYLQQMIHMLLDNAVQYANEGSVIRIWSEQKRRRIRLLFSNTVDALPDCPPENLFDRFYRGNGARTQSSGGYGIGLSAARAIAEMHHGTLSAEYADEHTICFIVELPL